MVPVPSLLLRCRHRRRLTSKHTDHMEAQPSLRNGYVRQPSMSLGAFVSSLRVIVLLMT
jgi:hypothetical protein